MLRNSMVRCLAVTGFFIAALAGQAMAQDRATAEEAQAMVADAIAYYDANGDMATFEMINADNPRFHRNDLYVFVIADTGMSHAHPIREDLVGTDLSSLQDADGKLFVEEFIDVANADGAWVDYMWEDPTNGELEAKSSWVVLHDGYIFGAGIYQP